MPEPENAGAGCPECGDRGWVVEPDGRAGRARRCGCRRRDSASRLLAAAGIPPLYRRCTLDSFQTAGATAAERDELVRALARCRRYVDEFLKEDGSFSGEGLLFVGKPGVGKTHLATAVLSELIRRYRLHGRFVDFTDLVHRIQTTFDPSSDASKHEVLDPVADCQILVLDELGAQQPTEWVKNTLYLVLNSRYTRQLPTLFTTNFRIDLDGAGAAGAAGAVAAASNRQTGFEEQQTRARPLRDDYRQLLEHRISEGLVSRLYEMTGRPIEINVGDYRREIKMQRHAR